MKKSLKIFGIVVLVLILFKGFIYRGLIKYNAIGTRAQIEITNSELIKRIELKSADRKIDLEEIAIISNDITCDILKFTTKSASKNPNELVISKRANCVGYSAMFNSIANHLIRNNQLESEIESEHKIGQLKLFGINLHQFFDSKFFNDHDYNELRNKITNRIISIDPVVNDYLFIEQIAKSQ